MKDSNMLIPPPLFRYSLIQYLTLVVLLERFVCVEKVKLCG